MYISSDKKAGEAELTCLPQAGTVMSEAGMAVSGQGSEELPWGKEFPWLAPLAGHTDLAFRILCREQGAAVACSEMISAKGLVYGQRSRKGNPGTDSLLITTPYLNFPAEAEADTPLVIQIFGEDACFLGEAASLLKARGFKWFDLNLGCSVPKVVRTGAGAALARDSNAVLAAAKTLVKAVGSKKIGFKLRLGWCASEENFIELGKLLEDTGAGWLTLHPRYAKQAFSGSANWNAISRLVEAVSIPVLASGDLFDAASAVRCINDTGASGVMFARGALQNPAIFREYGMLLADSHGVDNLGLTDKARLLKDIILRHAELAQAMPGFEGRKRNHKIPASLLKMRGSVPRYIKDFAGSRALRTALSTCRDWDEFYILIDNFFKDYGC